MTKNDLRESLRHLEENPGFSRVFSHCGQSWMAGDECLPAILCPLCGTAIVDINATLDELVEYGEYLQEQLRKFQN